MKEVNRLLAQKHSNSLSISIKDLAKEIENLKIEVQILKHDNIILQQNIDTIYSNLKDSNDKVLPTKEIHEEVQNSDDNHLSILNMVISQKWYTKITLLIEGTFQKDFIAMIDSGADLNVIQEGLIPTRYFQKTSHSLSHAGGGSLNIKYKLPKAYICKNGNCITSSFF